MEPIISIQPTTPDYETLPTYKITHYPLEPRDYMPYAQTRVCVTPSQFVLQMWAFEANPRPASRLEGVFSGTDKDKLLVAWVEASGSYGCLSRTAGGDRPLDCLAHSIQGEDLQGVYWGIQIALDRDLARREFGGGCLEEGGTLWGNFYKLSADSQKPHRGSMMPVDFATVREYDPAALAPFRVVGY